ncbi:g7714 [Coccomyxa elongata]
MRHLQLAPKLQPEPVSPTALPSSVVAGLAVGKAAAENGGRKMLESASAAPACCNSYTVKQGDTLNSIATTYGQPTNGPAILQQEDTLKSIATTYRQPINGPAILQAINGLNGTDISPGQSLMLPCGRILTYYAAFNAAAAVSTTASPPSSSG